MLMGILTGPEVEDVRRQIEKGRPLVDGFEWRLDFFSEDALELLPVLKEESGLPSLFTFRNPANENSIEKFFHYQPTYFDIDTSCPFVREWIDRYPKTRIIVSHHDFEKTPSDLADLLESMRRVPAYGYKIAVKSRSTIDMLRLMCFIKETGARLTGIPMGPLGKPGRIIGPIIGNFFDYAIIESHPVLEEAGLFSAEEFQQRYRYRNLGPFTSIYALLGDPVEHSRSHITHNALIVEKGWNKVYLKLVMKKEELGQFFVYASQLPFRGFSVTMPLKESIVPHTSETEEAVKMCGALNTLTFRNGDWIGANTDGKAAVTLIEQKEPLRGKRCIIIGAGGTACAIAYEALQLGARVILLNRTLEKALAFTARCGGEAQPLTFLNQILEQGYDVLVHATSVGFPGNEGTLLEEHHLLPGKIIFESIARVTPLRSMAERRGCRVIGGEELFFAQAALQFNLWK